MAPGGWESSTFFLTLDCLILSVLRDEIIVKRWLTFTQYVEQWQSKRDRVLTWFGERLMQNPSSFAVTWRTSFGQFAPAGRG
jgi:hypothetical protein